MDINLSYLTSDPPMIQNPTPKNNRKYITNKNRKNPNMNKENEKETTQREVSPNQRFE